jgi:hypothetical protein
LVEFATVLKTVKDALKVTGRMVLVNLSAVLALPAMREGTV